MLRNLFSKGAGATETEAEPSSEGPAASESRAYTVGWLLNVAGASVIWDTPRPVRIESQRQDPRSVGQCPSVLDLDRRHFVINCPIDLHLRLHLAGGGMEITNGPAATNPIRADGRQRVMVVTPP